MATGTVTKLQICNLALAKIGAKRITTAELTTPVSQESKRIEDVYTLMLDEVLAEHPWTFAQKRAALTINSLTIASGFTDDGVTLSYVLPTDFIKLTDQSNRDAVVRLEGGIMMSDTANLKIKYTYRNTDSTLYSAKFVTALAHRIAAEICFSLTNSSTKAEKTMAEYETVSLPRAMAADSQQGTVDEMDVTEWELAREGGGQWWMDNPYPSSTPANTGNFDNDDLTAGVLTITHNKALSSPYTILVQIYNNSGELVSPDSTTAATNSVAIDLSSFAPITGTWGYVYLTA